MERSLLEESKQIRAPTRSIAQYVDEAGLEGLVCNSGDFEAAKTMVENDVGWAILPENVAALPHPKVKFVGSNHSLYETHLACI
jgi:DNA-binding transcriptional LysR family regulator